VVDMVALGSDGLVGSGLVCGVKATSRTAVTEAMATPARTLMDPLTQAAAYRSGRS
jgi:hypothetical protein